MCLIYYLCGHFSQNQEVQVNIFFKNILPHWVVHHNIYIGCFLVLFWTIQTKNIWISLWKSKNAWAIKGFLFSQHEWNHNSWNKTSFNLFFLLVSKAYEYRHNRNTSKIYYSFRFGYENAPLKWFSQTKYIPDKFSFKNVKRFFSLTV